MPVDYDRVVHVAAAVADIYRAAELRLTRLVARQLDSGGFDDEPAEWAARKLRQATGLRRAAQLVADQTERSGTRAVRQVVAAGYRAGNATAVIDLAEQLVGDVGPHARGAPSTGGNAIQALADAAVGELRPVHAAILGQTEGAYRRAVAAAVGRRLAGVQDLRHAAQAAWTTLADRGVVAVTDRSGRRWQLSSWVEMSVRTAVARATIVGQADQWAADGVDFCTVIDRPRECPRCEPWETKILSLGPVRVAPAVATLGEAMRAGLFHPCCRHQLAAYLPGRSRPRPSPAPEGPEGYQAEQEQRRLERGVRAWRVRQAAAFTAQARRTADGKVAGWETALEQHLAAHPLLRRLRFREQPGAGYTSARRDDPATT